jgi:nitrogen fixation/metabolism regulation signal transduction histidine kinase
MALTRDIPATYRGPRAVYRRLLALGPREDRALAFVMGACAVMFIAQWPRLSREAHLLGKDLNMEMGGALLGTVFMLPLILYVFAGLVHMIMRVLRGQGGSYQSRLALFWALLASCPLALLYGLVAGFVGPGVQLQFAGLIWLAVFLWFWISGLRESYWGRAQ